MVVALFVRSDSIYKKMEGVDAWDIERDARNYSGDSPVVAHPPCRAWGQLRHFAKPRHDEKELALFAVDTVRRVGGVLEHPRRSTLWPVAGLPAPGERDSFGGWTLPVFQSWFGHRAEKATFLYIVGCAPGSVPSFPLMLGGASHVIAQCRTLKGGGRLVKGCPGWRPEVSKEEREHTPPDLAKWLVDLCRRVKT